MANFSEFLHLKLLWHLAIYLKAHFKLCYKLKLGFVNPFSIKNLFPKPIDDTLFMMTTCLPDLQPRHHLYDDRFFKFIGSTINEEVNSRNYSLNKDEKLEELLNSFEIKENKINILEEPSDKLIYVSLGTIFNSDLRVYKIILKAFKTFDLEPFETRSNIKLKNLKIIISTGSIVYNKFQELLKDNEYKLPKNMILVKSGPQTEILKRASLFVTHCGMNSTSESVHYGGYYKI